MSRARQGAMARTVVVDVADPLPDLDWDGADEWYVHVVDGGRAIATVRIPHPGGRDTRALLTAAVLPHAAPARAARGFAAAFAKRLAADAATEEPPRPRCSVVVCTRRRPEKLRRALEAVAVLDPPADEILVVDNAPDDSSCRAIALAAGARYIREDRPGLNRARLVGARAARGDVIAYTDDDCVPAPGWLATVGEHFADASVDAVTGPALPWSLDAPAQRLREHVATFVHGLDLRVHDLTNRHVVDVGGVGAGANMVLRRSALEELGDPFPPELDAGTATRSGGDLYLMYRLLAAGGRVVYDPAAFVFHDHRGDPVGPSETARGYGIGLAAYLTKILVEEREPATFLVWRWLWRRFVSSVVLALSGRDDVEFVRLRWQYLVGGLEGAAAWRKALRAAPGCPARLEAAPRSEVPGSVTHGSVSVVVVLRDAPAPGCLEALDAAAARTAAEAELVIVDCGPAPASVPSLTMPVRRVRRPAAGPAAARAAGARAAGGDVLLLWDAEHVADPEVIDVHLRRQREQEGAIVIGQVLPASGRADLATQVTALERASRQRRSRLAVAPTLRDVTWANASIPRASMSRVGQVDAALDGTAAEREWAARALDAGLTVTFEPRALARAHGPCRPHVHLERAVAQGGGDGLLVSRRPAAVTALSCARAASRGERAAALVLATPEARRAAAALLDALERVRARRAWLALFARLRRGCYEHGLRRAGAAKDVAAARRAATMAVELTDEGPLPRPVLAAPALELTLRGHPVGRLVPECGQWHANLGRDVLAAVERGGRRAAGDDWWRALPRAGAAVPGDPALVGPHAGDLTVLLGPQRAPGDDRYRRELEDAGIRVRVLDGDAAAHWRAIDGALREGGDGATAIPLPGVALHPDWLAAARAGLSGSRVAAVAGAGLRAGEPPDALRLLDRSAAPVPYHALSRPPQALLVTPTGLTTLGGLDVDAARLGAHAPLLDFLERALEADLLIADVTAPGLAPAGAYVPARRRLHWESSRAAAALVACGAARRSGAAGARWLLSRGVLPIIQQARMSLHTGRPTGRFVLGRSAAFLAGCATAIRAHAARR